MITTRLYFVGLNGKNKKGTRSISFVTIYKFQIKRNINVLIVVVKIDVGV